MKPRLKLTTVKSKRHYARRLKIDMPFKDALKLALRTKPPRKTKAK